MSLLWKPDAFILGIPDVWDWWLRREWELKPFQNLLETWAQAVLFFGFVGFCFFSSSEPLLSLLFAGFEQITSPQTESEASSIQLSEGPHFQLSKATRHWLFNLLRCLPLLWIFRPVLFYWKKSLAVPTKGRNSLARSEELWAFSLSFFPSFFFFSGRV